MTRQEFLTWVAYYELDPFDDYHRFYRPAALVASSIGGGSTKELLEWLRPKPPQPGDEHLSDADLNTLRAFGFRR